MSFPPKTYGNRLTRARAMVGSLVVGSGQAMHGIHYGSVDIDPPSIAAGAKGTAIALIPEANTGDMVLLSPPAGLNSGLVYGGAAVTGDGTVSVYITNSGTASVNAGSADWHFLLFNVT